MALRDKFLDQMGSGMASSQPMPDEAPMPAAGEAEMEAKMNEADAAFEDAMAAGNPEGEFSSSALNVLIDKVNDALKLFGEDAQEVPKVDEASDEFPTELTKAISMIERAAIDSGVSDDDMGLGELQSDGDVKMLAGKIAALAKNQNFKTFLKSQGTDVNAALIVGIETEPAGSMDQTPSAPTPAPEMEEDEMMKLFNSRM